MDDDLRCFALIARIVEEVIIWWRASVVSVFCLCFVYVVFGGSGGCAPGGFYAPLLLGGLCKQIWRRFGV